MVAKGPGKNSSTFKKWPFSQLGQTSVEYILLFVVVISLVISLMGLVKNYLISEDCEQTPEAMACRLNALFPKGDYENYRRFPLKRAGL